MRVIDLISVIGTAGTFVSVWIAFYISRRDRRSARVRDVASRFVALRRTGDRQKDPHGVATFLAAGALTLESDEEVRSAIDLIGSFREEEPLLMVFAIRRGSLSILRRAASSRADLAKPEELVVHLTRDARE